jgi:hypothetical protein
VSAAPKPEDLLTPEQFPDDLKWVPAHYKLNPTDPVYLLIGWHWRRVKQSEDTLQNAIIEIRRSLDDRIKRLTAAADTVAAINESLAEVHAVLAEKPAELEGQLDAKLSQPMADALARIEALAKLLAPLASTFQTARRRQLHAVFVVGVAIGLLGAVIVMLA